MILTKLVYKIVQTYYLYYHCFDKCLILFEIRVFIIEFIYYAIIIINMR